LTSKPPQEFRAQHGSILGRNYVPDKAAHGFFIPGKTSLDGQMPELTDKGED